MLQTTIAMAALACLGLALPAAARAHTFDDVSLEHLAGASDVIVIGRVTRTDVVPFGPGGLPGIHTRVELTVDEWLLTDDGDRPPTVAFWVHGGRIGNRMRVLSGQARFTIGEHVGVLLFRNEAGALWPTGMERGKWVIGPTQAVAPSSLAMTTSTPQHSSTAPSFRVRVRSASPP